MTAKLPPLQLDINIGACHINCVFADSKTMLRSVLIVEVCVADFRGSRATGKPIDFIGGQRVDYKFGRRAKPPWTRRAVPVNEASDELSFLRGCKK